MSWLFLPPTWKVPSLSCPTQPVLTTASIMGVNQIHVGNIPSWNCFLKLENISVKFWLLQVRKGWLKLANPCGAPPLFWLSRSSCCLVIWLHIRSGEKLVCPGCSPWLVHTKASAAIFTESKKRSWMAWGAAWGSVTLLSSKTEIACPHLMKTCTSKKRREETSRKANKNYSWFHETRKTGLWAHASTDYRTVLSFSFIQQRPWCSALPDF